MKSRLLFLTGLLLIISGFITSVLAVKAYPYPMEVQQPNGETISIQAHGDEYFHYTTAANGYLIMKDGEGYYRYANISEEGALIPGDIIVSKSTLRSDISGLITPSSPEFKEKIQQPAMGRMIEQKLQNTIENKSFTPSSVSSLRSSNNEQAVTPTPFKMKALVILANFTDKKFSTSNAKQAFTNLLNQVNYTDNGATGSARDYFIANSDGNFDPEFVVYGPVELPNNMAYYGGNNEDGSDKNANQMIVDACKAANTAYPDLNFNDYAVNVEGYGAVLRNVFVFYAGYNEAESSEVDPNTIWPHKSSVFNNSVRIDNVRLADYACTSELQGNKTQSKGMAPIGTFTHEFGHVLGLPDFYDANGEQDGLNAGVGDWSIMDQGNYLNNGRTPPCYSATERYFLSILWYESIDWMADLAVLLPGASTASMELSPITSPLTEDKFRGFMVATPKQTEDFIYEYFMLECRKKTGWDAYLPGEGMLVFHIDWDNTTQYTVNYGTQQYTATAANLWSMGLANLIGNRPLYDLIKGNNEQFSTQNIGGTNYAYFKNYAGHPFPGSSNNTSISDATTPNFRSWDGSLSGMNISNIMKKSDGSIIFNMKKETSAILVLQQNQPAVFAQNQEIYFKNLSGNSSFELYDISGRMLAKKQLSASQHTEPVSSKGIYIVKVNTDGQSFSYKIALQ